MSGVPFSDCPLPFAETDRILLGHGSGGKLTADLIERLLLPAFANPALDLLDDQAVITADGVRLAFSTDSYVVTPIVFAGGDIGELAVNGTINDLAMAGAKPLALSLAFILEEGLPVETLQRVVQSAKRAADAAGVPVVTGDTKVVGRGSADQLFVNTSGIGLVPEGVALSSSHVRPGDAIVLSGTVGDHGIAILAARGELELEGEVASDTAALHELVAAMLASGAEIHAMRDPTRGGLAATLVEISSRRGVGMSIDEAAIPVHGPVRGACEILGLDPLHVANEGKLVAFVSADTADVLLAAMHAHPLGRDAVVIGHVSDGNYVRLRTAIGGERLLDLPYGELLPRIC